MKKYRQLRKISEVYEDSRKKLILNLLVHRQERNPEINITMRPETMEIVRYEKRRAGQPRNKWKHGATKKLWSWIGLLKNPEIRALELE